MGRFLVAALVTLGIGYGGWSLLHHGADGKRALSAPAGVSATDAAAGAKVPDGAAREAGSSAAGSSAAPAAPEARTSPADVAALVSEADTELGKVEGASTRLQALQSKDRARRLLSRAFFATSDAGKAEALRPRIQKLNEDVLFSEEVLAGCAFVHVFRPTDRLWTLCYKTWPAEKKIHVEPGFLLWMNGLSDARKIREGQHIKVPTEELSLLVSKSRYRLWVLLGGVYLREFTVGVGVEDKTPEGEFEIETKIEKPDWYSEGKKVPYGNSGNPLGTRWMGFRRTPRAAGYGIHGTSEPGSVGKAVSQGCIRMENSDVEELFSWVPRGTRVKIIR